MPPPSTVTEDRLGDPDRLALLARTGLMGTEAEASFDRMTRMAARVLGVPVALVSLVDERRQFFKSCVGLPEPLASTRETALRYSFCQHVVNSGEPLVISDARRTPLVMDYPGIADLNMVAYAGIPLVLDGQVIGTFCAIDSEPRTWSDADVGLLSDLAESVLSEIRLRVEHDELVRQRAEADDLRFRLDVALKAGAIGLWTLDLRSGIVTADANVAELLGRSAEGAGPVASVDDFLRSVHPVDRDRVGREIARSIRDRGDFAMEYRVVDGDENLRQVQAWGRVILDEQGKAATLLGSLADLTLRKNAELLRREGNDFRRLVFDSVRDLSIYTTDLAGVVTSWNEGANNIFGHRADEVIGRPSADLFTPEDRAAGVPERELATALREGRAADNRWHLRGDGGRFFANGVVTPLLDDAGQPIGFTKVARDVTAVREAQEKIRQSEQKYRTLFDSIDEGFCVVQILFDADGRPDDWRYLEVNPAFIKLTGIVDPVGKTVSQAIPGIEREWIETFARVATTREPIRVVDRVETLERRWFDVYAFPVGEPGESRMAFIFNDITERRKVEIEGQRLVGELREADARKDEFLAMLAHELRNPLGVISSSVQLARALDRPEALVELRQMIDHQVGHLGHLVDDLLDVSRITRGKIDLRRRPVELSEVVDRAVALARPQIDERRHALTIDRPGRPVRFVADPTRVEQMISNLLTNAAKYSDPGKAIDLFAGVEGDEVVVRVVDQGHGVEAEMLPRIFGLFTQVDATIDRARGGLGIGLTLVKTLAEMHGGTIQATSPGKGLGSVFTLRLPVGDPGDAEVGADEPRRAAGRPAPRSAPTRVLVVDDNQDSARLTARMLKHLGFEVATAFDGLEGIDAARRARPEVILLDIGLPGMNGYDVASTLRAEDCGRSALIVAVSGYGDEKSRERSRQAGFDHHLTKPLDFDRLLALI